MKLAVVYESMTGNTRRAAELAARLATESHGADVSVRPVVDLDLKALAEADLLMAGTWTDGFVVAGMRPGGARRLWTLPVLDRKPAVVFCTYAVNPGRTLLKFQRILEAKGANVLGGRAFRRDRIDVTVPAFVDDALALVTTGTR
jgi:hypothetical protein